MKTIIKKGELLSKIGNIDEEVFKECLEEIFWEDVDSAFMFDSTCMRIDWKDNIPVRIKVELADEEYGNVNSITIITFLLNDKEFISYIYGAEGYCKDFYNEEFITSSIDNRTLDNILISYIGSLRKYSDEMDWSTSNESEFLK